MHKHVEQKVSCILCRLASSSAPARLANTTGMPRVQVKLSSELSAFATHSLV